MVCISVACIQALLEAARERTRVYERRAVVAVGHNDPEERVDRSYRIHLKD